MPPEHDFDWLLTALAQPIHTQPMFPGSVLTGVTVRSTLGWTGSMEPAS